MGLITFTDYKSDFILKIYIILTIRERILLLINALKSRKEANSHINSYANVLVHYGRFYTLIKVHMSK